MKRFRCLTGLLLIILLSPIIANAQFWGYNGPEITYGNHNNGKLRTTVSSNGSVGTLYYEATGTYTGNIYGNETSLWIGGVVGDDTLVSTYSIPSEYGVMEFWPSYPPSGYIDDVSPEKDEYPNQMFRPELIYRAEFTDTFKNEFFVPYSFYDDRFHKPLKVKVLQTSRSYNYTYADDFLIVEYKIQNLNRVPIKDAFVGFYHDGAVMKTGRFLAGVDIGDTEGFLDSVLHEFPELGYEQMNSAWVADVNGRPANGYFGTSSIRHTMAITPLMVPQSATVHNFNWWVITSGNWWSHINGSWGPRRRGSYDYPLRLFNNQLGIPFTDEDRYYMMSFPERDYPGYYAATDLRIRGWREPPPDAGSIADGHFVSFVTSVGPFSLEPGEFETITFAYVMGRNFHTQPSAFADLFNAADPAPFMKTLDQRSLIDNIRNAKRLFDNPGVDTNNDGDSGKFVLRYDEIVGDSIKLYYAGDGVPDYSVAKPPPPPKLRIYTEDNKVIMRWNGRGVENYFDKFSSIRDFEGYRVYISRSDIESELTLLASYDRENYNRYQWDSRGLEYRLMDIPFSLDSLEVLYGEGFDPLVYDILHPFADDQNKKFIFSKVDANMSDLSDPKRIHKVYPNATLDTNDVDEDGRMRYYEYEYIVDNLLSTIPYYVSLSTFDFGYPAKDLEPMESDPMINLEQTYAAGLDDWDTETEDRELNVYVYPNPYISDGRYRADAFENRFTDFIPDRSRAIYFANVPSRCTITIYTIDGDLIKRFEHDEPDGSGVAHVASWDVISKNMMTIESGLFYWVVESDQGKQIGKLVILR